MALVQKQFGELITFTRSSAGGRFNSAGVFEMVPANQPRFDYDPLTKSARGILIEEARTNLTTQSNSPSTISPTRAAYIETGQRFIDGLTPLRLLREDATPQSTHFGVTPNSTLLANTTYTGSYFVKSSGRTKFALWVGASGGWAPGNPQATFDLASQTVVERNEAKATLIKVTNDIYRVTLTAKTGANPLTSNIYPVLMNDAGDVTYDGDGVSGVFIGGYQVEAGAFATSYIPTVASQVTRTADIVSVKELSPWYNPTEGTMYVDYVPGNIGLGSTCVGFYMSSENPAFDIITIRNGTSQGTITGILVNSAGGRLDMVGATGIPAGGRVKGVLAFKSGDGALAVNGSKAIVTTPTGIPFPNRFDIGRATSAQQYANGYIRAIRYYPRRLTDTELEALTK